MGVISQRFINHGEELYVDYLADGRVPIDFTPDWLLEPPPQSPFLSKKKMLTEVPVGVKMLYYLKAKNLGDRFENFDARTSHELPPQDQPERKRIIGAKVKERIALVEKTN